MMFFQSRLRTAAVPVAVLTIALVGLPLLSGCTTPRAGSLEVAEADRWEATNRRVYQFNKNIDRTVLKPAADTYRAVIPTAARHGITNVYSTYGEPASLMNALLQGKISQAFRTLDRMIINVTLGVGGLADNATELGREQEREDFGQTFAMWGFESGPYMVLPFFGPSTLRDTFGLGADFIIDPADFARNAAFSPSWYWRGGQIATRLINFRARLSEQGGDALLADSLDEYALVKSVYLQTRRNAIYDGNLPLEPADDAGMDAADMDPADVDPADVDPAGTGDPVPAIDAPAPDPAAPVFDPSADTPAAPRPPQ